MIALVRHVAERLRPPRALTVPFGFGAPLGRAGDVDGQLDVLRELIALFANPGPPPVLRAYVPTQRSP